MAASGEFTRSAGQAMQGKELTSTAVTDSRSKPAGKVLGPPAEVGVPMRSTPGQRAGVIDEPPADRLVPQRPGARHSATTTETPVSAPRAATQAGVVEQSSVVAQAGKVQDRPRTTHGGGQVEGGGAYVSPVGTDAKPAHGGQGRDGGGRDRTGIKEPDKEPDPKSLMLAASLQTILTEFKKRGGELTFVQEWMFNGIGTGLVNGEKQGYIESFTGSGKSLPIALLAAAGVLSGQRVLIAARSKENLDQLLGEDNEAGLGKFVKGLLDNNFVQQRYGGRGGKRKSPIEFATYSKVLNEHRARSEGRPGTMGDFDLILGDECHWSLGTETVTALYEYMPEATKIGFSATPDYAEDRKSEEIWGNKWFEFSFRAALESPKQNEKQIIAPIRTLVVPTGATIELHDARAEFSQEELRPLIENPERNAMAIKLVQDFIADGRQIFIPTVAGNDNAHARVLAYMLSQLTVDGRQIVAKDHGSHLSASQRRELIKDYRDGKIDVLLATQSLDEAVDIPASVCIDLSPTTSPRKKKQRLGRIARPNEDGRESIYVEFVDEQTGGNKQLYTVLHALEIEKADVTRVLGWGNEGNDTPRPKRRLQNIAEIVSPDLLERLMSIQGKQLSEIIIKPGEIQVDPVFAMWEKRLAEEGMPAELPINTVYSPEIESAYTRAALKLMARLRREPTVAEVADAMEIKGETREAARIRIREELGEDPEIKEVSALMVRGQDKRAIIKAFAQRIGPRELRHARHQGQLPLEENLDSPQQDYLEGTIVMRELARVLDYLDPRQQLVIMERFGFNGEPKTLDEVGLIIDRTRESVRQIETRALNRLAYHARRNRTLNELMSDVPMYDQPQTIYQKRTEGTSIFDTFPEAQIPVIDNRSTSSYLDRLAIASAFETNKWLEGQRKELKTFIERRLSQPTYLREIAKVSKPIYRYEGHIMAHDPDGTAEKLYDPNLLRATALQMRQYELTQQMEKLRVARRRITDRPVHEDSQDARKASLTIINGRLAAMRELHIDLQLNVKDYRDEARESPDFRPIGSHLFT